MSLEAQLMKHTQTRAEMQRCHVQVSSVSSLHLVSSKFYFNINLNFNNIIVSVFEAEGLKRVAWENLVDVSFLRKRLLSQLNSRRETASPRNVLV